MTDRQLTEFIEQLNTRGICLGLESMEKLLGHMGHPEDGLKVIHIAGTNGKGSILAYVSTILKEAGYKVGRYLSPVITDYREKIQVNEKSITKKALGEGMDYIKSILESNAYENQVWPTLFEVETALCFWYFKKCECDYVVLECGLGGLTDATNIIKESTVDVFASISMDHMKILGDSIEDIAKVKSGIIKPGSSVVSAPQKQEALRVLLDRVIELGNTFSVVADANISHVKYGLNTQTFDYKEFKKLKIHMAGVWQISNAATAVEVILALRNKGIDISDKAIYTGLENTSWYGRFSVLSKKPLFIADGAHNEDASLKLRQSIETYLADKKKIFIIGVLADKEYEKVLRNTVDLADYIFTITPPDNPRALHTSLLAKAASEYNDKVTEAGSVEEAVEMAYLMAGNEYAIIAFGSLSYLGRLKKCVEARK